MWSLFVLIPLLHANTPIPDEVREEATAWLSTYVQVDTVNPGDNQHKFGLQLNITP